MSNYWLELLALVLGAWAFFFTGLLVGAQRSKMLVLELQYRLIDMTDRCQQLVGALKK